jgi:hypothetical protein
MRDFWHKRRAALVVAVALLSSCVHHLGLAAMSHPTELVGDWIDLRHTSAADTSLWVLRANGYDGNAHLLAKSSDGSDAPHRTEQKFGSWYFEGTLTNAASRSICIAKRLGRDGAHCMAFRLDTIDGGAGPRRRLVILGYHGQHHVGDEELIERPRSP